MAQDIPAKGLGAFRSHYPVSSPIMTLKRKRFQCPQDSSLYPTHPAQTLKEYHRYDRAVYDRLQLDGRDDQCLLSQVADRRPGVRPRPQATVDRVIREAERTGRKIHCQLGDEVHWVVMSDTYIDACGNYYRGVKQMLFLKSDESMGTLFSAGRTSYEVQGGFKGEQYDGATYAVRHTEFIFLAELLGNDMAGITRGRAAARQTHTLDAARRLFRRK
jgi:hypothetical protein